jgi:hypothetical protein
MLVKMKLAQMRRNIGAAIYIVLLNVGAAVVYGVLHDQVTAHVCIEYVTLGHVNFFNLGSPTLVALEWGFIATWWAGLALGVPVALVARIGKGRPAISAIDLLRPTLVLLGVIGLIALASGMTGYVLARVGGVHLEQPLASQVPYAKQVTFLADLWAHEAAYIAGGLGSIALCIWTWRRRQRSRAPAVCTRSTRGSTRSPRYSTQALLMHG